MKNSVNTGQPVLVQSSFKVRFVRDLQKNYSLYLLVLPVVAFYIIFHYLPDVRCNHRV